MIRTKIYLVILLSIFFPLILNAQVLQHKPSDFRGDINYRKGSTVDGNNIRTSIFNSGYSGNPGNRPDYVNYEFPKNTNRIYIALVNIILGGEVKSNNGEIIQLVEVPTGRTDPSTGNTWNME